MYRICSYEDREARGQEWGFTNFPVGTAFTGHHKLTTICVRGVRGGTPGCQGPSQSNPPLHRRNCSRVPYTNGWMESQLNRCILILERGRRLQYVPPYYHEPGNYKGVLSSYWLSEVSWLIYWPLIGWTGVYWYCKIQISCNHAEKGEAGNWTKGKGTIK